jgi:glyoxylase-like metal-dependent hydrolase (beta-lactamase superfamily II)
MKIGNYNLFSIDSGKLLIDGGTMFGVIPKSIWNRTNPSDEKNRITVRMRNLLMIGESKKILIDTGAGNKYDERWIRIYNLEDSYNSLISSLKKYNLNPESITDVILTHLHFDHAGGATIKSGNDFKPTFPNAKYYVQKSQLNWAFAPSDRDLAAFFPENFMPLIKNKVLFTKDGDEEIFTGIQIIKVNGHTPGQQIVRIHDSINELYFCADLIPLMSQIRLSHGMSFDLQPLITLEEKKQLISRAYENKSILFFEHDPLVECAYVDKDEKGYKAGKTFNLNDI